MFNNIEFANPEYFWVLIIIPLLLTYKIFVSNRKNPTLKYSDTKPFEGTKNWKVRLRELPFILRLLVIGLITIVLARPQTTSGEEKVTTEGIDIVLALDVSTSMLAEDLQPNRIKAAKLTAEEFIDTLSAPDFNNNSTSSTEDIPPPTVNGMFTCSATFNTKSSNVLRRSSVAEISKNTNSSAPFWA